MGKRLTLKIFLPVMLVFFLLLCPGWGNCRSRMPSPPIGKDQVALRVAIDREVRRALPWVDDLRVEVIHGLRRLKKKMTNAKQPLIKVVKVGKWNRRTGKLPVQVRIEAAGGRQVAQGWLSVVVVGEARVCVAAHSLEKGQLVRWGDVRLELIDCRQLNGSSLIDFPRRAVFEVVRPVVAEQPLNKQDLRPHRLVARGEMVTVVLEHENIRIITRGVAMSPGCQDQLIMVRNPVSRRTYQARVVDAGQVRVAY